jgi:hypothetical protein
MECEICGKYPAEQHHCVFRSAAPYMLKAKVNHKYLCNEHHRGNNSPHMDRKIDLKYKLEMQKKLFEMLPNAFYNEEELKDILELSQGEIKAIVKILKRYKEGFEHIEIVIRCMGGRLYAE